MARLILEGDRGWFGGTLYKLLKAMQAKKEVQMRWCVVDVRVLSVWAC